jgi:hypothetical protein
MKSVFKIDRPSPSALDRITLYQCTDCLSLDELNDSGSGSGNTLDSILNTVNSLGSAAGNIYTSGPANAGLATTGYPPYSQSGMLVNPATGLPYAAGATPSSGSGTLLLIGIVALIAYLAFVKM